jgi:hypothetical protein
MYIQNVIKYWHWDSYWLEIVTKEYKCGSQGYCAYNQVIGFRIKYSFHPNAWYFHWQSNLSKGLVSYSFCEAIMASNEKPFIPVCIHAIGWCKALQVATFSMPRGSLEYNIRWYWTYFDENGVLNCIIGGVGVFKVSGLGFRI